MKQDEARWSGHSFLYRPLLEELQDLVGCAYLAELLCLSNPEQNQLVQAIELEIRAEDAPLWDWNEVIGYIWRDPPEQSVTAAREKVLQHLRMIDIQREKEKA